MALTASGLITDSDDLADVTGLVVAGGADWRVREVEQEVEEEEVWQEVLTRTQAQTSPQVSRGCIDVTTEVSCRWRDEILLDSSHSHQLPPTI